MSSATPSNPTDQSLPALAEWPRPRPVRLNTMGKAYLWIMLLIVVVFEGILLPRLYKIARQAGSPAAFTVRDWVLASVVVLFLVVLGSVLFNLSRQKKLLANGDVALARVTSQWKVKANSMIRYEYAVGGATFRRSARDSTQNLREGMTVLVFHDRAKPSRQVAQCAAYYRVLLPGGEG